MRSEAVKQRTVIWKPVEYEGIEHLMLREHDSSVQINSVVIGIISQSAFRLNYDITCDRSYTVREVNAVIAGGEALHLLSDGDGNWRDQNGKSLPEFTGCLDIDFTATPFTNTLPIKRLRWQPGQSETFSMIYITVPDLKVRVEKQRYTCIEKSDQGGVYRYEGLSSGFTALLPVDADGLVLDYPGIWKRLWSV
jgi:uncharacterized protein